MRKQNDWELRNLIREKLIRKLNELTQKYTEKFKEEHKKEVLEIAELRKKVDLAEKKFFEKYNATIGYNENSEVKLKNIDINWKTNNRFYRTDNNSSLLYSHWKEDNSPIIPNLNLFSIEEELYLIMEEIYLKEDEESILKKVFEKINSMELK